MRIIFKDIYQLEDCHALGLWYLPVNEDAVTTGGMVEEVGENTEEVAEFNSIDYSYN